MKFHLKKSHAISNMIAFAVSGVSGIILNVMIVRLYDSQTLGLFHQLLAIYFVLSQIGTFGAHMSVLAHIPQSKSRKEIFLSALIFVAILSSIVACIFYIFFWQLFSYFNFLSLKDSLNFLMFSIVLFSLNKVMVNMLNAENRLNLMAISNAMRFVIMMLGVVINFFWIKWSIAFPIFFAELVLCMFLLVSHLQYLDRSYLNKNLLTFVKTHFSFGKFAVLSGLVVELNTKIDIIVLSFFVDQSSIGVYSFASTLGEGFYMLIGVFKNMNSPHISLQLFEGSNRSNTEKDLSKYILFFTYGVGIISILFYKPFAYLSTNNPSIISQGFYIYGTYAIIMMLCAKYLLLDNILILAKKPKLDNIVRISMLLANILVSLILVPIIGIYGAVLALSLGIAIGSLLLRHFCISQKLYPLIK